MSKDQTAAREEVAGPETGGFVCWETLVWTRGANAPDWQQRRKHVGESLAIAALGRQREATV